MQRCCQTDIQCELDSGIECAGDLVEQLPHFCLACKDELLSHVERQVVQFFVGKPVPASSHTGYTLRRETTYRYSIRLTNALGSRKLLLTPRLRIFFLLIPHFDRNVADILEMQIVHLYVHRHMLHRAMCPGCTPHCGYRNHPIFIGRQVLESRNIQAYVSSWGLKYSEIHHLLVDGPSAIDFKFLHYVVPVVGGSRPDAEDPFSRALHRFGPHTVFYTHLCICSALFRIYHRARCGLASKGLSVNSLERATRELCLKSGPVVYAMCINLTDITRSSGSCRFHLKRFGVKKETPEVGIRVGSVHLKLGISSRSQMFVF
jgi:hypothetical protein